MLLLKRETNRHVLMRDCLNCFIEIETQLRITGMML